MKSKVSAIINDTQFEKIELLLKGPNIFQALYIARNEIRHSNFPYRKVR
jgi:hypothetical protein